uniref:Sema domain-containing protein n=1 Tax=Strix occidentalis caurina TaxID=311401 RepID=A0A8D0EM26_STROC
MCCSWKYKHFYERRIIQCFHLLVNEEANTLFVGGRDAVFALDLNNISREIARYERSENYLSNLFFIVGTDMQLEMIFLIYTKFLDTMTLILFLHSTSVFFLMICLCIFKNKYFILFCFFQIFTDGEFYSATSNNFLGTEPIILRSMRNPVRTEFKTSWLNEPSFVDMEIVHESESNPNGDDDKMYVFFTEAAVEFEFYDKLLVSRIAHICRGDLGGKRILQRRWTSFLKSCLSCSIPELNFHFNIVQDIFLLRRRKGLHMTKLCNALSRVFSKGSYKGPVTVEHSPVKWMVYRGEVPVPRPGACIDNFARSVGYNTSSDLPDKVLQFVRDHPLMDNSVNPIGNRPVLLRRGSSYTWIVVDRVTGLDKQTYNVCCIGTDDGYLHKAFNCDGEMFIVEELQLFLSPEPVQSLRLSSEKGMLYIGSPSRVVQVPVSTCHRYKHRSDCVLARDPYCAWSQSVLSSFLVVFFFFSRNLIQSVKYGDASSCLKNVSTLGNNVHLKCAPLSNLARIVWKFNGRIAIFNITIDVAGFCDCLSVEKSKGKEFLTTVARYALYAQEKTEEANVIATANKHNEAGAECFQSSVPPSLLNEAPKQESVDSQIEKLVLKLLGAGFALLFCFLLVWNFYRGHLSLPWKSRETRSKTTGAAGLGSPAPATEGSGSVRKSSAMQTNILSIFSETLLSLFSNKCSLIFSCLKKNMGS